MGGNKRKDNSSGSSSSSKRKSKTPTDTYDREFYVEKILDKRTVMPKGQVQYFVKWLNYPVHQSTWEPVEHLSTCPGKIDEFEDARNSKKPNANEADSNDSSNEDDDETKEAESIVGFDKNGKKCSYVVKWKGSNSLTLIPSSECQERFPKLIIRYWESRASV